MTRQPTGYKGPPYAGLTGEFLLANDLNAVGPPDWQQRLYEARARSPLSYDRAWAQIKQEYNERLRAMQHEEAGE